MIGLLFYEVLAVLSSGIGSAFFVEMFPEKRWKSDLQIPMFAGLFGVVSILQALYEEAFFISHTGVLICSVLYAAVVCLFYRCKYEDALIWQFFYSITLAVLKLPVMAFQEKMQITEVGNAETYGYSWNQWELLMLVWYIMLIVLLSMIHKMGRRTILPNLKRMLSRGKSSLFGTAVLAWCLLTLILYTGQEAEFFGKLLLGIIAFVAAGILFVRLYQNDCMLRRSEQELLLQQSILLREQETIRSYYDRDAKRLHDMKHVLLYLYRCIEEQNLEKAKVYLESYTKEMAESQKKIWTGLTEIDFSVNYYYQLMQEKGIAFSIEADVQESPLKDLEMMIVLGNLLENAMTAAEKCLPGRRTVRLKMKNVNEMFFLRIENSSIQLPKRVNGRFFTSKKEKAYHGLGIENVRQIIEKHGGTIQFSYTEQQFRVEVTLFGAE